MGQVLLIIISVILSSVLKISSVKEKNECFNKTKLCGTSIWNKDKYTKLQKV